MMLRERHRSNIGLGFAAIVLCAILAMRPGLAAEAASAHGDGKASKPSMPSGESGSSKSIDENAERGATKTGDKGPARGNDGGTQQGERGRTETGATGKSLDTGAPGKTGPSDIDTRISVQPRRLGAKPDKAAGKTAIGSPLARRLQRPIPPTPRMPNVPVRNALGVPVQQRANTERRDLGRPFAPAAPGGVTAAPSSAGSNVTGVEGPADHRVPTTNPVVVPPGPNRGAINGTGLTHRNVGPPLIGGPKAAAAGVNGTTIKPKH
jgi:hypothetical protein